MRGWAVFFAAVFVTGGCSVVGLDGERGDLGDARERWEATRPIRYSYTLERRCFCGVEARGPVRITVDGEQVVGQVYVESGAPVTGNATDWFPPVEGLFDILQDALDRDAHEVRVLYAPDSGVPIDVWIDYEEFTADEELGFLVTESVHPTS